MPGAPTLRFSHFYLCHAKTVRAASLTMSSLQAVLHNDKHYDSWACGITHQVCSDSILLSSSAPSAARLRRLPKHFYVLLLHPAKIIDGKVRRSNQGPQSTWTAKRSASADGIAFNKFQRNLHFFLPLSGQARMNQSQRSDRRV